MSNGHEDTGSQHESSSRLEALLQALEQQPWLNTEQERLYTGGLWSIPLFQLIPMWLDELKRVGLTGGKDDSAVDAPPKATTVPVDVHGQRIEIKLDAYRDEDGDPRAEVREQPARTDLGILGVLAATEGGAPDPQRIWADYERLFEGREPEIRDKFIPVPTESEKVLMLAQALLEYRDASAFAELTDQQRRERVVSVARRIAKAHKAIREISADLETGTLWTRVEDAQRDVKAAELRDLKGWTWFRIGQYLGIPQGRAEKQGDRRYNQSARKAAEKGRKLLKRARSETTSNI